MFLRIKYAGVNNIIVPKARSNWGRQGALVKRRKDRSYRKLKIWSSIQSSWKGVIYLQEMFT